MSYFLAMNPLDFALRYTVLIGVVIAGVGVGLIFLAKNITKAVKKQQTIDKNDKLFQKISTIGWILVLIGMIVVILPIEKTLYGG